MYGTETPRIWTKSLSELTPETTLGYAFIEFCKAIDVELMPWQKWLAIHALETITEDGKWRFRYRYVIILISRQNGKTYFEKLLNVFFLFGLKSHLVLGTAQNLDTAVETFEDTVAQVEEVPELKELLKKINRGTGKREMLLENGDRYKVIAATRKARGLSSDLIMMDELREQTNWEAWGAISKTMLARPTAILFGFSNAGDVTSVVLRHLRLQAHAQLGDPDGIAASRMSLGGEDIDDSLALFEWSAEPSCEIDDVEQWAQANPSMNHGFLTERSLRSAMTTDPEAVFRTECLCQWVETILPQPFPDGSWDAGVDSSSDIAPESAIWYGIDMSADRRWVSLAACGMRDDGAYHIEVIDRKVGSEWVLAWFLERVTRGPMKLCFQTRGTPVAGLAEQICQINGVERCPVEGPNLTQGWGRFYDAVVACKEGGAVKVFHLPQPVLDMPAKTMQYRNLGGGVQLPDRTKSPDDISALNACFYAFAAATQPTEAQPEKRYQSAYTEEYTVAFA